MLFPKDYCMLAEIHNTLLLCISDVSEMGPWFLTFTSNGNVIVQILSDKNVVNVYWSLFNDAVM